MRFLFYCGDVAKCRVILSNKPKLRRPVCKIAKFAQEIVFFVVFQGKKTAFDSNYNKRRTDNIKELAKAHKNKTGQGEWLVV